MARPSGGLRCLTNFEFYIRWVAKNCLSAAESRFCDATLDLGIQSTIELIPLLTSLCNYNIKPIMAGKEGFTPGRRLVERARRYNATKKSTETRPAQQPTEGRRELIERLMLEAVGSDPADLHGMPYRAVAERIVLANHERKVELARAETELMREQGRLVNDPMNVSSRRR